MLRSIGLEEAFFMKRGDFEEMRRREREKPHTHIAWATEHWMES